MQELKFEDIIILYVITKKKYVQIWVLAIRISARLMIWRDILLRVWKQCSCF
jgi:hypothetical protein